MTLVALVLSLLVAALGALGVASPTRLVSLVRYFQTPAGLYIAAALRLVFGVALFVSAPTSRAPGLMRILGVVIIVVGVITPLFGLTRFRRLIDWWLARGPALLRVWAALAFVAGLLLAYALVP